MNKDQSETKKKTKTNTQTSDKLEGKSTEQLQLIFTEKSLKAEIVNPNGHAVYIVDTWEIKEVIPEPIYCYITDDIYNAFSQNDSLFLQQIQKPINPVIVISDHETKTPNFKAVKVINTLKAAGVVVFKQNINKPFLPIVSTGLDKIRAEIVRQYRENYSAGGSISEFDNVIKSNANTPAIQTGFKRLDKILDGGLYEGLYTIGAISSLGKTTFCENIADQITKQGQDVIIISLEMSRFELIAKSISRLTFCKYLNSTQTIKYEWCKTARGITDGSRYDNYSQKEKDIIKEAKDYYAQNIGQHLFIYEAIGDMNADIIREIVKNHVDYTGARPVVIVDYLQLLQHPDKYINGSDKQRTDANVSALKRLSRDYKIPVIAISSVNRMSYESEINFSSFKESGGIEFSSDVVIGLQLAGVGKGDFNVNEAKAKDPREIELVMLKNRQAKTGEKISFYYYPMFNNFIEIVET